MPLKPIFDKAPLTALNRQSLRAGLVKSESATLKNLYREVADAANPIHFEGAFRLACIVCAKPAEEPVTARIREALAAQQEDGSFALSNLEAIALLRAAWALYEYETRKPLLDYIAKWCVWAAVNWDSLMADNTIWANPADLMLLLEDMYRVTGKAALLKLCERVATQTMVWSGVLNTLSVQRPTNKDVTRQELLGGLAQENGNRDGYYTQYLRTHHAVSLADGARAALAKGMYTGSATELNAARVGWEKLSRYHGAVCGGLTSDALLEGTSPAAAVSTESLGAWAEALTVAAMGDHTAWAWDAVECMAFNAMPAAVSVEGVVKFQAVNDVYGQIAEKELFLPSDANLDESASRLARGYASVYASAVMACPDGAAINLYLPGRYAVTVDDALLVLNLTVTERGAAISLHCKEAVKAVLRLRVPTWSRSTEITVNNADMLAEPDAEGVHVERLWHDGDIIHVNMEQSLRVMDGHHQGKYILRGPVLMALNTEKIPDGWAMALDGARVEEKCVAASLVSIDNWKLQGSLPADIPVLPATREAAAFHLLTPYARTVKRIALFPGRKPA